MAASNLGPRNVDTFVIATPRISFYHAHSCEGMTFLRMRTRLIAPDLSGAKYCIAGSRQMSRGGRRSNKREPRVGLWGARMKYRLLLLTTLALIGVGVQGPASGEQPPAATAPKASIGAIDPKALDILKGMSDTLAKAKSMSFNIRRAFDEPASNGQPLFYMISSNVTLQRPDKLKIVTLGDGPASEFYYDGAEMAVFLPASNLIAVESAPPKLDDMLEAAYSKAGIYFPFVDFIVADPYAAITEGLTSAFVMGQSTVVGGTTTDIVAIANANFQAQIWIGAKDKLPRLVWLTPAKSKDKPRSMLEFSNWRIDAATSAKTFRSTAAAKAGRIKFSKPGLSAPANK